MSCKSTHGGQCQPIVHQQLIYHYLISSTMGAQVSRVDRRRDWLLHQVRSGSVRQRSDQFFHHLRLLRRRSSDVEFLGQSSVVVDCPEPGQSMDVDHSPSERSTHLVVCRLSTRVTSKRSSYSEFTRTDVWHGLGRLRGAGRATVQTTLRGLVSIKYSTV